MKMSGVMAMSAGTERPKRSFEYRMSKKVAELTQVVHMLFTRNHEKEVEVEALKEAYEFEISEVISDAKRKILELERQREEMLKEHSGDADRIRRLLEGEFQSKEQEWKRRLEESEQHLREERAECQNLRDLLIRAQLDIENLRQNVSDKFAAQTGELAKRDHEIERLKKHSQNLEQSLKDNDKDHGDRLKDMEKNNENLERELRRAHAALDENHQIRDDLLMRNKQLEADIKALKRDFHRKVAEVVNGQKGHRNGNCLTQAQSEELERLRREIQRYRLELSNRDANFNRMFTDKQPIHVDRGGVGALRLQTSHSAGTVHPSTNIAAIPSVLKREKATSQHPAGPVICFEDTQLQQTVERQRAKSSPSVHVDARDSRLPSICSSPDIKAHSSSNTNRLTKPRPLPKEMLFGK